MSRAQCADVLQTCIALYSLDRVVAFTAPLCKTWHLFSVYGRHSAVPHYRVCCVRTPNQISLHFSRFLTLFLLLKMIRIRGAVFLCVLKSPSPGAPRCDISAMFTIFWFCHPSESIAVERPGHHTSAHRLNVNQNNEEASGFVQTVNTRQKYLIEFEFEFKVCVLFVCVEIIRIYELLREMAAQTVHLK